MNSKTLHQIVRLHLVQFIMIKIQLLLEMIMAKFLFGLLMNKAIYNFSKKF